MAGVLFALSSCVPIDDAPHPTPVRPDHDGHVKTHEPDWNAMTGALVQVTMDSTVGVLLDDFPAEYREQYAQEAMEQPDSFWLERAKTQLRLTNMRLNFRNGFYPKGTKWQLPLPTEDRWKIVLDAEPVRRKIDGHDLVLRSYTFTTTILTDEASPGKSEPALAEVGGVWNEPFVFPADPLFVFQRTGYACINEAQFPPNSHDAEESDLFYDHGCRVEPRLSNVGCHQTEMPAMSCIQALQKNVGRIETAMTFTRVPYDRSIANAVRSGSITNPDGPDLEPDHEEFRKHRFTYRYIPSNSCTLEEQCVGAAGWRRLLMFPTADLNRGLKDLNIGWVDYFHKDGGSTLSEHGMFELSECHGHYHFSHYGTFALEDEPQLTRKNGFCMQPTQRRWNNELSPLHHPFVDCEEQGVSPGWIDEYKMGLECQWLDITGVEPKTAELSFISNPDGMLCEGTLGRGENGEQLFEPSEFTTTKGTPVDRPVCDEFAGWRDNNADAYDVTIPHPRQSYVTADCAPGHDGMLRNCGFENVKPTIECDPGSRVRLRCSTTAESPQFVRVCEASRVLGFGIPCTEADALAAGLVDGVTELSFACPTARDAAETGGLYSFMFAALFASDATEDVTCEVL